MSTALNTRAQYLDHFAGFERSAAGRELPWLRQLRREAFARFCEIGFPSTRDEDWRFTNTSALANTAFSLAGVRGDADRSEWLASYLMEGTHCRLVFLDGRLLPELSLIAPSGDGVKVAGLADALASSAPEAGLIERHMAHYASPLDDGFAALNMAFAEDGAFVEIPRGVIVEEPIHLLFLSTLETFDDLHAAPIMSHPRNLILAGENSQAGIVEEYISLGSGRGLTNAVTELVAGDGAVVAHYRIEREQASAYNISTLRIEQGRSASVASHSVLLGGALVRNNVHPVLAGEGGECLVNGLFLGRGTEHIDNYMLVEHASPHCGSRQFYNGILDGHAHGVFHGRIIVRKDAQKTDAKQTNRNLLLSDDAQIDTKPQLEIHADDVKCTHGATIGQVDDEALFYLRSRGIAEEAARHLLLLAFAEECMGRMSEGPARAHVERLVRRYVLGDARRGEASHDDAISEAVT